MTDDNNMEKIKYYNNGYVYRPDSVSFGNLPDGGLSIYCYNDMPCPPDETIMIKNENDMIIRMEDVFPEYDHVRYMQCGVRLTPGETNELILSLMTVDNSALISLRDWLKKLSPEKRQKIFREFEATMRYLFPQETKNNPHDAAHSVNFPMKNDAMSEAAETKSISLKGEELNRYLDMLNHRNKTG